MGAAAMGVLGRPLGPDARGNGTLSRNLPALAASGYTVIVLGPRDWFPQTDPVETLVLLVVRSERRFTESCCSAPQGPHAEIGDVLEPADRAFEQRGARLGAEGHA